jgi:hypothetical protein
MGFIELLIGDETLYLWTVLHLSKFYDLVFIVFIIYTDENTFFFNFYLFDLWVVLTKQRKSCIKIIDLNVWLLLLIKDFGNDDNKIVKKLNFCFLSVKFVTKFLDWLSLF